MAKFKITLEESIFLVILLIAGIFLSSETVILFLDSLTPFWGLVLYYVVLYIGLFTLSKLGLTVSKFDIKRPLQIIGALLITFSFFIIINFESPYNNEITGRHDADISPIYFQSEDGATWHLWSKLFDNIQILRWLTFVITPFILSFMGVLLVSKKIEI